jgi:hypothetical protein
MMVPATSFTNPATGTTYRLVVSGDGWRVTKARNDDGQLKLVHLRGRVGADPVDLAAVARLVAGEGGATVEATHPAAVFAAVVLRDLDGTADVLMAIAREAREVYEVGCPGFRPRSAPLRQQRDAALSRAASECRLMAEAWRSSGLKADGPLPDWLAAALDTENPINLQVPN